MQEGLLARIAGSPYARKLILKGGFLLFANQQAAGRTTKDIDFLGDGIPNDPQALAEIFAVLVSREYGDGLSFDVDSIRPERITEVADYHGVRLHMTGRLGTVRNTIQVDIGFGYALEGGPRSMSLRKLLDDTPGNSICTPRHFRAQEDRHAGWPSCLLARVGGFRKDRAALERLHSPLKAGKPRALVDPRHHQDEARTAVFEDATHAD